ncbi:hypothetical protein D3C72_2004910 [compost metagenome]
MGHGWLVETKRTDDGSLQLHPTLCMPRPGHYFGCAEGHSEQMRIEITADRAFRPLGPHRLQTLHDMWRLEGQVSRRKSGRSFVVR